MAMLHLHPAALCANSFDRKINRHFASFLKFA